MKAKFFRYSWLHILLLIASVLAFVPFIWMVATSFKGSTEVLSATPTLLPKDEWHWTNYIEAFKLVPFARFYFNTVVVTVGRVLGQVVFASMAAFAFARLRFPGRDYIFLAFLITMMVPSQVTLIPNYVLLQKLDWLDSFQGLIVPSLFSAFGTFLLRQYFMTIPKDLEDAAVIDGCNPLQIYAFIFVPLSRAALIAFGVLVTLWSWNDFLWPLIITSSNEMQMLSVGIAYFQNQYVRNYAVMMAAATVATLPMLFVFLLAQKYLIEGITMSGLKL